MKKLSRIAILQLAAKTGADPRTAEKAMREGPEAVRGVVGERLAAAMSELGIPSPSPGHQAA